MQEGWIKLYRQISESEVWTAEKFSKGQAWVDLLLLANHKPHTIFIRGIEIKLKKGELAYSQLTLAKRWRWNRKTVMSYLSWLENREMICTKNNNVTTLITIRNYVGYQGERTPERTPEGHQKGQQKDTKTDTDKNDNNENNENKNTLKPKRATLPGEDFIQALKTSPAYKGVNIDHELARMDIWFLSPQGKGRKKTHRFITNWLDKADRTLPPESPPEEACTRCGTTNWTSLKNIDKERLCEKCLRPANPQGTTVRNGSGTVQPGGDTP